MPATNATGITAVVTRIAAVTDSTTIPPSVAPPMQLAIAARITGPDRSSRLARHTRQRFRSDRDHSPTGREALHTGHRGSTRRAYRRLLLRQALLPLRQQFRLAFGRDARAELERVGHLRDRLAAAFGLFLGLLGHADAALDLAGPPLEDLGARGQGRAGLEARGLGLGNAALVERGVLALGRDVDRQVAAELKLLGLEEVSRHPHALGGPALHLRAGAGAGIDDISPRRRWPHDVEGAPGAILDARNDEVGQVAHVDPLRRLVAVAGDQHLAPLAHPHRPVGEAIRVIAHADDVSRAQVEGLVAEDRGRLLLAERLERAVVREVVAHDLDIWIGDRADRIRLVGAGLVVLRVNRERRDEDVHAGGGLEKFRRGPDHARVEAGRVDDRVPLLAALD